MKNLLNYLVTSLVVHPDQVVISEENSDNGKVLLIKSHPEDVKIIIGKEGRTIRALRELVRLKAIKERTNVEIKIDEDR